MELQQQVSILSQFYSLNSTHVLSSVSLAPVLQSAGVLSGISSPVHPSKLLLTMNHRKLGYRLSEPKPVFRLLQTNPRQNNVDKIIFLLEWHRLDLPNNIPKMGPPWSNGHCLRVWHSYLGRGEAACW